jgi:hypothetical protein
MAKVKSQLKAGQQWNITYKGKVGQVCIKSVSKKGSSVTLRGIGGAFDQEMGRVPIRDINWNKEGI